MLISKARGVLILAVFVQDGVPVLVGEGHLYLKCAQVCYSLARIFLCK